MDILQFIFLHFQYLTRSVPTQRVCALRMSLKILFFFRASCYSFQFKTDLVFFQNEYLYYKLQCFSPFGNILFKLKVVSQKYYYGTNEYMCII